tara:strand:+ start:3316 stop:3723 length:408 start_codon:yes stop_codon:yes gene_type:complete
MDGSKKSVILIIIALLVAGIIGLSFYRSQRAPTIAVEKILSFWRPGYHNLVGEYWHKDSRYETLYNVRQYKILKSEIRKDQARVITRVNYITGHKLKLENIFTFLLSKSKGKWKAYRYYKGFKDTETKNRRAFLN